MPRWVLRYVGNKTFDFLSKKRIFCPKTTKFGIFGQFGPGHAGLFSALLWVHWWLWRAGCISQGTYLLYDFVLLVNFLGHPVYDAHTSRLFSGQPTILHYFFCFLGCLLKENKVLSWMLSFICLVLYFLWAYFTKFTNSGMYVFSPRKHFKPLLCNLTHRMILFNSGLQKLCNPAIPDGRGVS